MKNTQGFQKFINQEPKAGAKKEAIKQQKRDAKKGAKEVGNSARKLKLEKETGYKSFKQDDFKPRAKKGKGPTEPKINNMAYRKEVMELKNWTIDMLNKPAEPAKPKQDNGGFKKSGFAKQEQCFDRQRKPFAPKNKQNEEEGSRGGFGKKRDFSDRTTDKRFDKQRKPFFNKPENVREENGGAKNFQQNRVREDEKMPLNKFVAHCGICGRREAAELIKKGLVKVNGDIITEPGHKVIGNEDVKLNGKRIFVQHNLVYILLNKPKDYITTAKDPEGRKTVLDLIGNATSERIYPVGRLDRNTTGVLLLTNDGELAQKLTHPSFEIKKIYEVRLDKPVTKKDMDAIVNGIQLEDGFIQADSVAYGDANDKSIVGIEIHSGRNRIVRRIFEHLGYDVRNLDRVMFANLTKKNVDRGKYRFLSEKEVRLLKYMNKSFAKK